jgi:hypothetical protein
LVILLGPQLQPGDVAQADVRVTSEAFVTDDQGEMTSTFESGAQVLVHADADFSNVAPTRAVTAQDALEALRLSVGMATTGGQSDAFALIAADFNQSGQVNAHDALEILRYAVRAEGALDADWVFVDTNGDYSSINRRSVEFEEGVGIASLTDDAEVYLTGILRGDVNDSISTTPHASLAALAHYRGRRVAILVGGHDRGLDWSDFVTAVRSEAPAAIVCTGANGPRIAQALRDRDARNFALDQMQRYRLDVQISHKVAAANRRMMQEREAIATKLLEAGYLRDKAIERAVASKHEQEARKMRHFPWT